MKSKNRPKPLKKLRELFMDSEVVIEADTYEEAYERYKKIQCRNLILKVPLFLLLGVLFSCVLRACGILPVG